jgi:hypothetical protein
MKNSLSTLNTKIKEFLAMPFRVRSEEIKQVKYGFGDVFRNHETDELRVGSKLKQTGIHPHPEYGHFGSKVLKVEGGIVNHPDIHPAVKRLFNHLRRSPNTLSSSGKSEEDYYNINYKRKR